jgi:hypothetical protein
LRDELLIRSGEDFEAVMNSARRSIGIAVARGRTTESIGLGHSDEFWQDYSTCMMLLSIASDRIRDFVVMAMEDEEYDSGKAETSQKALTQNRGSRWKSGSQRSKSFWLRRADKRTG